jgi:hypothetical protein
VRLVLKDTECVLEVESEPEPETLTLREEKLLAEGHCDADRVAHWVAVRLPEPLPLRVTDTEPEAVLKPWCAAPPVALGQNVEEGEGKGLKESLALGVMAPTEGETAKGE